MAQPKRVEMADYVAKAKRVLEQRSGVAPRLTEPAEVSPGAGAEQLTLYDSDQSDKRAAALAFINRSAARLVCPDCQNLPEGSRYAVLVPEPNDTPEFRAALRVLRLDGLPVLHRRAPLGFRPEAEHQRRRGA